MIFSFMHVSQYISVLRFQFSSLHSCIVQYNIESDADEPTTSSAMEVETTNNRNVVQGDMSKLISTFKGHLLNYKFLQCHSSRKSYHNSMACLSEGPTTQSIIFLIQKRGCV